MRIEIIIPSFNNSLLLNDNLPAILESINSEKHISISIVDDGSRADEQKKLKEVVDRAQKGSKTMLNLMLYEKNVGFASNVNRAMLESQSDIVILLNSDVVPEKDFIKFLLPHFNDELVFGVGMMDKSVEGDKVVLRGRGVTYWKKGLFLHKRGEIGNSQTSWISGGSCALRTSMVREINGFNKLYNPFYWEDIDLSYVARKIGYKILFEEKSVVTHFHDRGAIKSNYKQGKVAQIAFRNQLIFIWKNITDFDLLISHIVNLPLHLLKAFFRFDWSFITGFLLAVMLLPDIMNNRKMLKKKFILKDKQIIP